MNPVRLPRYLGSILGIAVGGVAVFAPQLGLDANNDWGPSRKLLLTVGLLILVASWGPLLLAILAGPMRSLVVAARRTAGHMVASSHAKEAAQRLGQAWTLSPGARIFRSIEDRSRATWSALLSRSRFLSTAFGTREARVSTAAWAAFVLVAVSYLWFVSVGTWIRWPETSAYQDLQADAFLHGQTDLRLDPPASLLALADPYDPGARAGLSYLWDASLFRGRYYLYWGPVPALLLVPIKALVDIRFGDNALVLMFSIGCAFWCTRLLARLWKDRFREIPGWMVVGTVLAVGWANPAPWLLNSPWIYEAAIVGGQFFLLMGVNALYSFLALERGRVRDLAWAGASLSLAVGTRSGLVAATGVVTVIVFLRLWAGHRRKARAETIKLGASYLLPLIIAAVALGVYNYARFGSPLELGHRYQLTSIDLTAEDLQSIAFRNVPPNLYNYLVNPVRRLRVFPYIKPRWGGYHMSVLRIPVPPGYYSREIAGLLLVAPFALFALGTLSRLRKAFRRRGAAMQGSRDDENSTERVGWLSVLLVGTAVAQLVVVLSYIVASMRYQGDFLPSLMLASTLGLWGLLAERMQRGMPVVGYGLLAFVLMVWTSIAGLLLGVTSTFARFEGLNPDLFQRLTEFFTL